MTPDIQKLVDELLDGASLIDCDPLASAYDRSISGRLTQAADLITRLAGALERIEAFKVGASPSGKQFDKGYASGFNGAGLYAQRIARQALTGRTGE